MIHIDFCRYKNETVEPLVETLGSLELSFIFTSKHDLRILIKL